MRPSAILCVLVAGLGLVAAPPVAAAAQCPHAVVFTLPGITWSDVRTFQPPNLLRLVSAGAAGSVAVRTNTSRTSYGSGYATVGGGARLDGPGIGAPVREGAPFGELHSETVVAGLSEMREEAEEAGYEAVPGALAAALGDAPVVAVGNSDLGARPPTPVPRGRGRWALLAAMDARGVVGYEASGPEILADDPAWPFGVRTDPAAASEAVGAALDLECSVVVVDPGDLIRADQAAVAAGEELPEARRRALAAADDLIGAVAPRLDFRRDLLLVVSPTSPAWERQAHLGVAVARGPGYGAGDSLVSASTRRYGIVTLPDVAPTVLDHLDLARPDAMNGRPFTAIAARPGGRITEAVDLDRESVFIDRMKGPISGWFVVSQLVLYVLVVALLAWRERRGPASGARLQSWLEAGAFALVAFPIATFLVGVARGHVLGAPLYVLLLLATDAVLVALASWIARDPLDRLLILGGFTLVALSADLLAGARLQLNTVFGYSPIVAGRFAGAGNIAFAVLGAAAVVTGSLLVHRASNQRRMLVLVAVLFGATILVDGAPQLGSDVGGVLALVPALGVTWVLLAGRKPTVRIVLVGAAVAVAALALFLAVDLARPATDQTHLGRLYEDVRARGPSVLMDTIERKAGSNLRVFRTTIWTVVVPPALGVMAFLVARPRGRWGRLAERFPKVRAGLVGGLCVAVLGFAVNDSGIVIPAVVLGFLVPMALVVHLVLEKETGP